MKKITSIIAVVMMICILMTACTQKEVQIEGFTNDTPVFECAGVTINYDEYCYILGSYRATYEQYYGADYWTTTDGEANAVYIRSYVDTYLQETCGYLYWADQLGLTLDEADEAEIESEYQEAVDHYGSEEALLDAMASSGMNKDLYLRMITESVMINKLYDYVAANIAVLTEDDIKAYAADQDLIRVQHVLIKNDEGDDPEANLKLAEEIRQRAIDGEDFTALALKYSEDSPDNIESGYTFGPDNQFMPEFSEASLKLDIGEVSDIVTIDDWYNGYHIIKRVELNYDEIRTDAQNEKFYNAFDKALAGQLEIKFLNDFNKLNFTDIVPKN